VLTIAAYTLVEALRNRLLWLLAGFIVVGLALAAMVGEVAITDTRAYQAGLLAAFLRLSAVFTAALFVVSTMVRERDDKGLELVLSLPLPRASYLLGKQLGFSALTAGIALACALALLPFAPLEAVARWGVSLGFELVLVSALGLLFVVSFPQLMWALSGVLAFYLLARSIAALQLMGHTPLSNPGSLAGTVIRALTDAIAFLLPSLGRFTRSDWLVHLDGSWSEVASIGAQSAIYTTLLLGAALFDFYRRNL